MVCFVFFPHLWRVSAAQSEIPTFICYRDNQPEWESAALFDFLRLKASVQRERLPLRLLTWGSCSVSIYLSENSLLC